MLKTCYGIRILDPQRLRTFRSVVATGSVQGAADQLRLTSSAVSQQLTVLQRETGLTLLERVGRGVRPTPAGMTVAIASGDALRSLNRLGALVRDLREGKTGHLTIGHFSSAGLAWMPRIVKRMRAEYPDVMIELVLNEAFDGSLPTKPDIDVRIHIEGEPQPWATSVTTSSSPTTGSGRRSTRSRRTPTRPPDSAPATSCMQRTTSWHSRLLTPGLA